jgi:hypothetical protein
MMVNTICSICPTGHRNTFFKKGITVSEVNKEDLVLFFQKDLNVGDKICSEQYRIFTLRDQEKGKEGLLDKEGFGTPNIREQNGCNEDGAKGCQFFPDKKIDLQNDSEKKIIT